MPDGEMLINKAAVEVDVPRGTSRWVLDHGLVRLVDYMGGDISVARAARVSYDAAWRAGEDEGSDAKLIRYLWKHRHTTPFEAVTVTFEVLAPIFVLRQWHRHRTQSYNELSARYRELPELFYVPDPSIVGQQATTNKQGRTLDGVDVSDREGEVRGYEEACRFAFRIYRARAGGAAAQHVQPHVRDHEPPQPVPLPGAAAGPARPVRDP